jgi:hypothetical protein
VKGLAAIVLFMLLAATLLGVVVLVAGLLGGVAGR